MDTQQEQPAAQEKAQGEKVDGRKKRTLPESARRFQFQKGKSGNPSGMQKGTKHIATKLAEITEELQASISRVEKIKGKKLLDHFVEQAFEDNKVLVACAKKILPDLVRTEGNDKEGAQIYVVVPVNTKGEKMRLPLMPDVSQVVHVSGDKITVLQKNGTTATVNGNGTNGKHK